MNGFDAASTACAVADRSDLGRVLATGPDVLSLLHRLSTGDVKDLRPGDGRETVLTSAKGRIVERLFVHHLGGDGVLMLAGPGGAPRVIAHLTKFTFAEQTGLSDATGATFAFALLGPRWSEAARAAGLPDLPAFGAAALAIGGVRVHAVRTNGFDADGVLVVGPSPEAERVRTVLDASAAAAGGGPIDAQALDAWRISKRLPAAGHELTEAHNPLEAGLLGAVSFTKGCYVGQEVVARLNTYDKVARSIVRLDLGEDAPLPEPGAAVLHAGKVVGEVTSAARLPGRAAVALAYVKSREMPDDATPLSIDDRGTIRYGAVVRR